MSETTRLLHGVLSCVKRSVERALPPSFEVPFALFTFADRIPGNVEYLSVRWLSRQLERTLDFEHSLMQKNTADPVTLAARIYETTRLPNVSIYLTAEV